MPRCLMHSFKKFTQAIDAARHWHELERTLPWHPDLQPSFRYYALIMFTSAFIQGNLKPIDEDINYLYNLFKDETALTCERAHAGLWLGQRALSAQYVLKDAHLSPRVVFEHVLGLNIDEEEREILLVIKDVDLDDESFSRVNAVAWR